MIDFKLKRSKRRTLSLEVRDGGVIVRAPLSLSQGYIERFVASKTGWVKKRLKSTWRSYERGYRKGEYFLFLGAPYKLDFKTSQNESVEVFKDKIVVKAISTNAADIKRVLKNFYLQRTKKMVDKLLVKYPQLLKAEGPKIIYKYYCSKWGSCSAKNTLSFNAKLSMAPPEVIEYVVIHELVHLEIKNHSRSFWAEVEKYDISYKTHRKWLSENNQDFEL